MTKLFLFTLLAVATLSGCGGTDPNGGPPPASYFSMGQAEGRVLKDKDGCAFIVFYQSGYGRYELKPLIDDSLPTCKLFRVDPPADVQPTSVPSPAQSVN